MERWKHLAVKLLFPHPLVVVLLVMGSAAGLVWVFANSLDTHPIAYVIYPIAFYALCTVTARVPAAVKRSRARVYANPLAARYLTERELRLRISLYSGTVLNLAFGGFKLLIGIYYRSFWFGAVGVYYMVLSLMRYLLVRAHRSTRSLPDGTELLQRQWQGYRTTGALLLAVNATMTGVVFQIIWQSRSFIYPGFVIYASAAYTFYRLTKSIIQTLSPRTQDRPLYAAAKVTDLSVALMSVFALQTAMFNAFGGDMTPSAQRLMNTLTGGTVCFAVVCMAVWMLVNAHKNTKSFQKKKSEN